MSLKDVRNALYFTNSELALKKSMVLTYLDCGKDNFCDEDDTSIDVWTYLSYNSRIKKTHQQTKILENTIIQLEHLYYKLYCENSHSQKVFQKAKGELIKLKEVSYDRASKITNDAFNEEFDGYDLHKIWFEIGKTEKQSCDGLKKVYHQLCDL